MDTRFNSYIQLLLIEIKLRCRPSLRKTSATNAVLWNALNLEARDFRGLRSETPFKLTQSPRPTRGDVSARVVDTRV